MLQIKNVNLNVGNTALLSNINLTLEQGKIYGVLGPNGAGKTTLFKSMLGLTAFSGEILSDGQPVSSRCFGSLIEYPAFLLTAHRRGKFEAPRTIFRSEKTKHRSGAQTSELAGCPKKAVLSTFFGDAPTTGNCSRLFRRCSIFTAGRTYQRS